MVESSAYSQSQRNPHLTRNFRVDEPVRTHTVFSYNQRTRSQGCYHGYQINKGKTQDTLKGSHYEQSMTDARIEAYEDAVTTKAWHDEWEIEPDDFGTPEPLLVLNRRANIDLRNHARQTKSTYLCHWDQGHEPRGVLAQRLAEANRSTEKEQAGICIGNEQDLQRMRVKRAVRNAEVIDLTGDDTVGESKLGNCVGIENVENYPPGTMAQPWEI